jgi:hypothetical protein
MQPGFTGCIVVSRFDGFVEDVRVVTAETNDFLYESGVGICQQLLIAAIP